ncbi:MAG: hypothetical protein JW820_14790 [Spirochaetales bacterium]|nr:hypothetical protein [Spirochaetales bacterium]
MRYPKSSAIYALAVGLMMIGMWTFFILSAQVPELEERPVEIVFHLTVEFATAVVLVTAGLASLGRRSWGLVLQLFGFGMLAYTVILSPGYYAQRGQAGFVVLFAVLLAATLVFLVVAARGLLRAGGK